MSINPASVPVKIKDVLEEVLARKLYSVPGRLYPAITINDILLNNKGPHFPFNPTYPIAPRFSATLAGVLGNIGAIKQHLTVENSVGRFADWDFDVLLSYFCANIESKKGVGHYNFNGSFQQTRVRLFKACQAKSHGKASDLELLYIHACLEENGYDPMQRSDVSPTHHREMFIRKLMNSPADDFKIYGISQLRAIEKQLNQMLSQWNTVRANLEGFSKIHTKLIQFGDTLKALFSRPDRRTGTKLNPRSEEGIVFDLGCISDRELQQNLILAGLVKKMPGFMPYDTLQINENPGSFDFNDFAHALADLQPTKDDEHYNDDFTRWGKKEFDIMAEAFDFDCE